jgi:subtilase family serine protease
MRTSALLGLAILVSTLSAQQGRIAGRTDRHETVVLKGNVNPQAQLKYDQGAVDPDRQIPEMMLVLKRSPAQQAALQNLLADQQDQSSPLYHQWLTPQQYADRFGLSRADMAKVADWLTSEGFGIDYVAQGRDWILFSGTAGQVRKAFQTEIHSYRVDGEMHYANATDPSLPAALKPVTLALLGLDDFLPKPASHPLETTPAGGHLLVPADLGIIYDIAPLWAKGINGTGIKIAVTGQADLNMSDVSLFRSHYGLPANDPQKLLVPGSAAPAVACCENNLDLEWSGAMAPNATLIFVYSHNAFTSASYAIDQNLAPIVTYSFYTCEAKITSGSAGASANQAEAQKANAEGITWVACTGDSGAALCDPKTGSVAQNGLAVGSPSSIPEVTAVGGTEFNEASGTYWQSSNNADRSSALGYIPEKAWNDSSATGSIQLASTTGGASMYYPKPAWQTGPSVPNDGHRDVPDISFTASWDHDGYWYAANGEVTYSIGGTSASTPVFAGILALLNQYLISTGAQSKPGLGNINPILYTLAQTTPGIFNDITVGSNIVPCVGGTKDCPNGTLGYSAGPGYDLATGLGSADIYKLVTQWNLHPPAAATTTVTANPASMAVTASTTITATVKANTGTATPTGSVSFSTGSSTLGSANLAGSAGSATASITIAGNQLATGNNTINASYSGNTGFNPSSASVTVAVTVPTTASAVIPSVTPNPVYQQKPDADGYSWFYTVKLTEIGGVATTLTGFSIGGTDYSSSIVSFFGSATIPAKGSLSSSLRSQLATVPSTPLSFSMTVGGVSVTPDFVGIPYYLVGVTQVNFTIPQNTPLGSQPVVVTVGDNSSVAANINVTQ